MHARAKFFARDRFAKIPDVSAVARRVTNGIQPILAALQPCFETCLIAFSVFVAGLKKDSTKNLSANLQIKSGSWSSNARHIVVAVFFVVQHDRSHWCAASANFSGEAYNESVISFLLLCCAR